MRFTTQGFTLVQQWIQKLQTLAQSYDEQQETACAQLVRTITQSFLLLMQQTTSGNVLQSTLQRIANFLSYRTSISLLLPELAHATNYQSLSALQTVQIKGALFNGLQQVLLAIPDFLACFEQVDENDRLLLTQFNKLIQHLRLAQQLFRHFTSSKKAKKSIADSAPAAGASSATLSPDQFLAVSSFVFKELHEMATATKLAYPQESLDVQAQREDDGTGLVGQGANAQAAFVFSIKIIAPEQQLAPQPSLDMVSEKDKLIFSTLLTFQIEEYQALCHAQCVSTSCYSAYSSHYQRRLQKHTVFSSLITLQQSGGITPAIFHQLAADKPFLFQSLLNSEAEKLWGIAKGELKIDLCRKALHKKDSHGFFIRDTHLLAQLNQAITNLPSTILPGQESRITQRQQLTGCAQAHHDKKYALSFLLEKARVGELCFADLAFIKESFPRHQERFYLWGKSNTSKIIEKIEQDLTEQLWILLGGEGHLLCEQLINDKTRKLSIITANTTITHTPVIAATH